ncbi:hypothetical protein RFI_13722 [Reticulomyxa filosa]|uniref:Uncharacterized protein n=1 Tax=Reticulomyxa filosa TaxID=46433 RepID=X6NC47_RETFI|nr:hypothetical protein RFI_13722 [Reticulomyxa filosa]|eukprot:ETO23463.1 hypothetical protein RFI_13722 [Reticulomyxa filosa]
MVSFIYILTQYSENLRMLARKDVILQNIRSFFTNCCLFNIKTVFCITLLEKFELIKISPDTRCVPQIEVNFDLQKEFMSKMIFEFSMWPRAKKNKIAMAEVGLTTGKKTTTSQKLRFLMDEDESKEEKLHQEHATHDKMQRLETAKGNMNKFILQFQYVKDAYNEIDKAFCANMQSSSAANNLKDKMLRIVEVGKINIILNYLGYPKLTNEQLRDIFGKEMTTEQETMSFKRLLVGNQLFFFFFFFILFLL